MKNCVVTLNRFRHKIAEYLLYADRPVVITRNQVPVGYFIPAKLWLQKESSESMRDATQRTLVAAGFTESDVAETIDEHARVRSKAIVRPKK